MSNGISVREVADQLNISIATASRIRSTNKENMPVNKGGRPRKLQPKTVQYLKLDIKRGILKTAVEASTSATKMCHQPVSAVTVRRRLREAGLIAKRVVKKPALKRKHIK
ncbi:hypothetical protein BGX24_007628, partial [Mortierella sp. AD032]